MNTDLTHRTVNGLKWSYLATIITAVFQLILTAVMARLIDPSSFGLLALANVVLKFCSYFSQMGVGPALIQKNDTDDKDINSAYIIAFLLGISFLILIQLLAPFSKMLFPQKNIALILQVLSFTFVFVPLSSVSIGLLRRNFRFFQISIVEVSSYVLGSCIGITMALCGFGIWSLVCSILSQSFFLMVFSFYVLKHKIEIKIYLNKWKNLLSYGSKFSFVSFLEFITYNISTIIMGNKLSTNLIGIYDRANLLIQLPSQYLTVNLNKVLFPAFSEAKSSSQRLKKSYSSFFLLLSAILVPMGLIISVCSKQIVLFILGEKWLSSIEVLKILALGAPFNFILHSHGTVFDVKSELNKKLFIRLAHLLTFLTLLYFLKGFGVRGYAWAYTICEFIFYFVYTIFIVKILNIELKDIILRHGAILYVTLSVAIPIYLFTALFEEKINSLLIFIAMQLLLTMLLYIIFLFLIPPKLLRDEILERVGSYIKSEKEGWYKTYLTKLINLGNLKI